MESSSGNLDLSNTNMAIMPYNYNNSIMQGYQDIDDEQLQLRTPEDQDQSTGFIAKFNDGYTFRSLIEFLRVAAGRGNYIFGPDGIIYNQRDATNTMLNDVVIDGYRLPEYEYSSSEDKYYVGFNNNTFSNTTKQIKKKVGFMIWKKPGDCNIYTKLLSSAGGNNNGNIGIHTQQKLDRTMYLMPVEDESNPICTVAVSEFVQTCDCLIKLKCSSVVVHIYSAGIMFEGKLDTGVVGGIYRHGDCDRVVNNKVNTIANSFNTTGDSKILLRVRNPNVLAVFTTRASVFKVLTKINNLAPTGCVRLFLADNSALKILCEVGFFATLRSYIRAYVE